MREADGFIIPSRFSAVFEKAGKNQLKISSFIYDDLLSAVGLTIGEDVLAARLGVAKDSADWAALLESLKNAK